VVHLVTDETLLSGRELKRVYPLKRDWVLALFPNMELRQRLVAAILKAGPNEAAWPAEVRETLQQVREELSTWQQEGLA
jgi:hypothetical protein